MRKHSKRLLFLWAALIGTANAHAMANDCAASVQVAPGGARAPLERTEKGHLVVEAMVDGHAVSSVIDTGAMGIGGTIHAAAADRIQPAQGERETLKAHGAHASAQMQRMVARDVTAVDSISARRPGTCCSAHNVYYVKLKI